jgi:polyhydroxybutyrate depolymerase
VGTALTPRGAAGRAAGPAAARGRGARAARPAADARRLPALGHGLAEGAARPAGEGRAARLPLVVVLHGHGASPATEARRTGLLRYVATGAAVVVYPAGERLSWNAGRCCGFAHAQHVADLGFLRRLIARARHWPGVAPRRLFLVGFSNGGKMVARLVCSGAVQPTAVAVAEAVPVTGCGRAPPTPLLQIAAGADPLVPYARPLPPPAHGWRRAVLLPGGVPLTPVRTVVRRWAGRNGCHGYRLSRLAGGWLQSYRGCAAAVRLSATRPGGTAGTRRRRRCSGGSSGRSAATARPAERPPAPVRRGAGGPGDGVRGERGEPGGAPHGTLGG